MGPATLLLLLAAGPAQAGELGVGVYAAHLATPADAPFTAEGSWGGRLRYRVTDVWAGEAWIGRYSDSLDTHFEIQRFFGADPYAPVRMFGALGYGVHAYDRTAHDVWDAGVGLNAALWPWIDLRADLRYAFLRTPHTDGWDKNVESGFYNSVGLELHAPRVKPPPPPPPDTDGDGLLDPVDQCPTVAEDPDGHADDDGCPDLDDDEDGVLDVDDKCPAETEDRDGFEDEDGCPEPDNDKDGIPDKFDAAPNEPETFNGYQDKDGAPDEVPAEVQKFSGKIEGITFATGKDVIASSSFATLDEAAAVLVKFEDIRLEVQGHTDDVGDDAKNLDLSQRRAQAVVTYLVGKGVAADRLVAKGYGETMPVAPNDSSANRALNRRVEFVLQK